MKKNYFLIGIVAIIAIILSFAGCKKETAPQSGTSLSDKISKASQAVDSLIMTPDGWMPKSHVHLIENGTHLEIRSGHMLKIQTTTGKLMEDFGALKVPALSPNNSKQSPVKTNFNSFNSTAPSGNGWVTYSEWGNTNGQPINYFSTTWTVPPAPPSNDGQLIYIWNGLEPYQVELNNPGNLVIQPVLQWGSNGPGTNTFGGQYWTISNWVAWSGGAAYTTPQTHISPGTNLQGVLTYTSKKADGSYNYTCAFTGYSNVMNVTEGNLHNHYQNSGTIAIPNIPIENWAYEVLEVFNVIRATDYPNPLSVNMTNISVQTGPPGVYTPAALNWTPEIIQSQATFGEHTYIVNDFSSGTGEVDIFFHPQSAPIISYPASEVYYQNVPITPVSPTNSGGTPISYSINPQLPAGLNFNTSTGVISQQATVASSPGINYTITATNSGGSSHSTINITVNATTSGQYTFQVFTNSPTATFFDIVANGTNISGPRETAAQGKENDVTGTCVLLSNSTIVVQVTAGYMPVSAIIRGPFPDVNGVINGSNITFTGVNLTIGSSCGLIFN